MSDEVKAPKPRYSADQIEAIVAACSRPRDLRTLNILWDQYCTDYDLYTPTQHNKIFNAFHSHKAVEK
jgi:hypothetical protein